jgi:phage tail sheath protein FI
MGLFSLSPSVDIIEQDYTLIVPAVAASIGGFSGVAAWGPVGIPVIVNSENTLVRLFGSPDPFTQRDFMTAAQFLSYSNNLKFVRVVGDAAKNSYSGGTTAPRFFNLTQYEDTYTSASYAGMKYAGKYPGVKGNSITVSIADAGTFEDWAYRSLFGSEITINRTITTVDTEDVVTLTGGADTSSLSVGMKITAAGVPATARITEILTPTTVKLSEDATASATGVAAVFTRYTGTPGTSAYVETKNGSNDEVHVVVIDTDGVWSGTKGAVLERFVGLSKAFDAKDYAGASNYYVNVLNRTSAYVWWGGTHEKADWGGTSNSDFTSMDTQAVYVLANGVDDNEDITLDNRIEGYSIFNRAEEIDVSLLFVPGLDNSDEQHVINDYVTQIAVTRKDCMTWVCPPLNTVVNNRGNELQSVINFFGRMNSTSYAASVSGWKYVYSVYSDDYLWVPMSADGAGLCARTDSIADPWWSPAGLNRGFINNVVKLAYNPGSKAERDALYVENINPICIIPNEGVVLFGDKTMQRKPSAFDRINVRRLFIVMEKAIATMARYQLFEFNDRYTRTQFVNAVRPYLRTIQGRRGLTWFEVICDETNNTPQVIMSNSFVGQIKVRPNYSINFIELRFAAVGGEVEFTEVEA